jgi:lipopolysaccharide export system protein LptA
MFYNKFVLADGTVLYDNIVSVSWTEQVNSDSDNITPGAVCANAIDIEFWITSDGSLAIAQGSTLTYYKVDADTGTEHQIGIYTCEKPEKDGGNKYKVTAYDNIAKLDIDVADWLNSLNFPITIEAFANSLAAKCGLTFKNVPPINGDYSVQAFTANSSTGRDLMKMVAQATGCFIRAAANGELEYAWYVTNSKLSIATNESNGLYFHKTAYDKENKILRDRQVVRLRTADVVYQPKSTPYFSGQLAFSDFTVTAIDKVQVKQSDDDVGVIYPADAAGTNALVISANRLLVTDSDATLRPYVKNLYDRLNNMVYVPCSNIQTPETLDIRAGDIVTVTDGKRKFVTWITSVKRSGNRCTFESVGSINRNTTTAVNNAKYNSKQKILEISATVDGLTVKAEQTTKDIRGLSTQHTQLKQTFDKFELTAVTDGNVRSKFALDQTSVTIESGTITFKGDTLVVDSDNFKLKQDGTVSITGTLTSQTTYSKAIVGDGEITLSQKVSSGEWSPAVRIYSDGVGGSYLLGHITVYGDQGSSDKRVDIYTDQGGAKMAMRNASGKTFMMFESDGSGEGHLSIGGENGLGYLECKRLRIDGHNVALSRVNYTNEQGKPTWEYLLTAHQNNAWE